MKGLSLAEPAQQIRSTCARRTNSGHFSRRSVSFDRIFRRTGGRWSTPVEATIALSIAFVASELIKQRPGERRLSESYPWVVAFAFGLLHGFGFAGALKETGMPQTDVPLALLTFNLGVEAGQLLFVAAVLIGFRAFRAFVSVPLIPARLTTAYLIGVVSMIWLIARLNSFGLDQ
jgi:HupE / UreJ protein